MSSETGVAAPAKREGLTVSAVARRMGVAPATLRTWDRRYGVGPSEHTPGSHRRYTPGDLARLEHMRRLVIAGITPAEAARAARELDVHSQGLPSVIESPPSTEPSTATPRSVPVATGRAGGGSVVALPGGGPAVRGLARAAQSLDGAACSAVVSDSLDRHGVVPTWDDLLVPVLVGIGQKWSDSGRGVDIEHVLSAGIQDALAASIRSAAPPINSRTVLLACAPDEMHSLVLWAIAAALAEHRIGSRILGASLPATALTSAVQRLGPAVVFVWAQVPATADVTLVGAIPSCRPTATVLLGGPGWYVAPSAGRNGTTHVANLADTVARITHALGG